VLNHKLISCDDHLDLNQLPPDLWLERLEARFRDRAPHVEEKDGRAFWVCDGQNWGGWSGKAGGPAGPKPIFTALDRGGIVDQTERRPAVPELRLADMDRDGVWAQVVFGPVASIKHADLEFVEVLLPGLQRLAGDVHRRGAPAPAGGADAAAASRAGDPGARPPGQEGLLQAGQPADRHR
jgi:hypothetical protein